MNIYRNRKIKKNIFLLVFEPCCKSLKILARIEANPLIQRLFEEIYSSNYITKKEPKSDDRLSKFDWHDLSPIFLAIMLLHNLKVFKKPTKYHLLAIH